MKNIWSFLMFAAAVYGVFIAALFLFQSRLIYFPNVPSRRITATPDSIGLPYEAVSFVTDDGVRLDGWFLPAPKPRGAVLFFHGNAGNISHRLDSLKIFHELEVSTFIFDYRGYGSSEGSISEPGTYRDAKAAWRYLTKDRQISPRQIILFGRSLGAAVATYQAAREKPAGLILESAFTSVPDLASDLYPFIPARRLARFKYDTREYLQSVDCPVLIVHSPEDDIIPYRHGEGLYAAASEPKRLLMIHGDHNSGFLISGDVYFKGLDGFLTEAIRKGG